MHLFQPLTRAKTGFSSNGVIFLEKNLNNFQADFQQRMAIFLSILST